MSKLIKIDDHKKVACDRKSLEGLRDMLLNAIVNQINAKNTIDRIIEKHRSGFNFNRPIGRRDWKQAGYSLVELVVVVAIVGALATIAIPYYQSFAKKAQRVEAKSGLSGAFTAMVIHQMQDDNGAGTSNMKKLGFKMKGSPKYSYGFKDHTVGGSLTTNKAYASSGNADANTGATWPTNSNVSNAKPFKAKLKCANLVANTGCTPASACQTKCNGVTGNCEWRNGTCVGEANTDGLYERDNGLMLGKEKFIIGAIAWFGSGSQNNSTNLDGYDALVITDAREISQTKDGIQ